MLANSITACRLCGSSTLEEILDLRNQCLSDFRADVPFGYRSPRYPLRLLLCHGCHLPQLSHNTPPSELYHDRYSFKSGVNETIREDLRSVVSSALAAYFTLSPLPSPRPSIQAWLDIASNDGTLLSMVPNGVYKAGVDPLPQFADEAKQHADRIHVDFFDPEAFLPGMFDIVTSVSMFYDLPDPNVFARGVAQVLSRQGVWVIQQNYLPAMMANNSVDNISHEHLAYYDLTRMARILTSAGLEANHVESSKVNGGCFRLVASHRGTHLVDSSVTEMLMLEAVGEASLPDRLAAFAQRARTSLRELGELVRRIHRDGQQVYVYGASTRGAVMWQAAGLDFLDLPLVVDRNPDKVGKVMTAIGSPIISEQQFRETHAQTGRPTHLLVGPWWFRQEFIDREQEYLRAGGKIIFPLPKLEVVK